MKLLIKIMCFQLLLASVSYDVSAQTGTTIPLVAGDTVVNTGTASKTILLTGGFSGVYLQADVRKLSGTVGGTLQLFASVDGVSYVQVGSDQTVTNTTGTKAYAFSVSAPVPVYLRVIHTGTGTMSSVLTLKYVIRKYQER